MKKIRTGTMLYPHIIKMCDDNLLKANVKSRNEFIEQAIKFYTSYLNTNNNVCYLNDVIANTLDTSISSINDNLSRILFKFCVELNTMMRVQALYFDIDEKTLNVLTNQSIEQVSKTIGKINLNEVFKEFKEKEE